MVGILKEGCYVIGPNVKLDLPNMVDDKPLPNKSEILSYLKSVKPGPIAYMICKDPVTEETYSGYNACYEKDGFTWSTIGIYMFEKYNMKLNDDFLSMFKLDRDA